MTSDCENLIRNMLVVDPEKRYSLQQIKQHKWFSQEFSVLLLPTDIQSLNSSSSPSSITTTTTAGHDEDQNEEEIDSVVVDSIARELALESSNQIIDSVTNRKYDQFYAMYHLLKDTKGPCTPCSSAPPSPPLLPIIAAGQQRKSSITTGVVEREPSTFVQPNTPSISPVCRLVSPSGVATSATLSASCANSSQRRHTFGPDGTATTSSQTMLTPPLLFLTPPTTGTNSAPPTQNLAAADPYYPISHMDLLKPPPVLLINNNTGRRASDGQATYNSMCASTMLPMDTVKEGPPATFASTNTIDSAQMFTGFVFPNNTFQHRYLCTDAQNSATSTPSPPSGFGNLEART